MTRKDSEKDSERPHYYSQFWLDVAAGRRIIGTPRPGEDSEAAEPEHVETPALRKSGRVSSQNDYGTHAAVDGRHETIAHPVVEPLAAPDEFIEPEDELDLPTDELDELDIQDLPVEDTDIPDMDLGIIEDEEDEEL